MYYHQPQAPEKPCTGRLFWIWSVYAAAMSWLWSGSEFFGFGHGAVWAIAGVVGLLVLLITRET
jgi:hypothetical protein